MSATSLNSPALQQTATTWTQLQDSQSFKLSILESKDLEEPFKNAFAALKIMNPDYYQLPPGVSARPWGA